MPTPVHALVADLSSGDSDVRLAAVDGLGRRGEAALAYVEQMVPLLGDENREVRDHTVSALTWLGDDVVPALRRVRRRGPGKLRRGALTALAELCDPADLHPADQAALRRLIDIKQLDERPQPMLACFPSWIAVRTGDQAGVIDLLGLTDPQPATFTMGTAAADSDSHDFEFGPPYPQYARVYVTPELDGWTLVVGRWCSPIDEERSEDVAHACRRLSARFGAAQAYFYAAQQDGSAWLVAENGAIVRRGASDDELVAGDPEWEIGEPLPFERQAEAKALTESTDPDWEWEFALLNLAPKLAGALSLNPLTVDDATPCRGRGVLALTPYGTRYGVPRVALPV